MKLEDEDIDMDELHLYGNKLDRIIHKMKKMTQKEPKDNEEKHHISKNLSCQLVKAKLYLESYSMECRKRGVSNISKKKYEEYQKEINSFVPMLNTFSVMSGDVDNKMDLIIKYADQYKDVQLIESGIKVQEQIEISLKRQLSDLEETKIICQETMIEFEQQEEKIKMIADDVEDIKQGMKFAWKRLGVIARNLMKDWAVRGFCFLILIALIVVVVLIFVLPTNSPKT